MTVSLIISADLGLCPFGCSAAVVPHDPVGVVSANFHYNNTRVRLIRQQAIFLMMPNGLLRIVNRKAGRR